MFASRYWAIILTTYLACVGIVLLMPYTSIHEVQASDITVKVGVYDNPPIAYADENKKYRGLSVEVLEHIANLEGWTLKYVPGTWAECIERLMKGEIDLQVYITAVRNVFR
jgi:ABC-type amino acid transport substrate-binding protein